LPIYISRTRDKQAADILERSRTKQKAMQVKTATSLLGPDSGGAQSNKIGGAQSNKTGGAQSNKQKLAPIMRFKKAATKVKIAANMTKKRPARAKARFRRTSCTGGAQYRANMQEMQTSKLQEERKAAAGREFKRYLLKNGPMLVMAQWDDNNDGVISRHEFKKGLENYGMSVIMGPEIDTMFKAMDANGDGVVEYSELEDYLKAEWSDVCDEEVSGADIRRQYAENRAMMSTDKRKEDARKDRKKLAEAKAARELKEGVLVGLRDEDLAKHMGSRQVAAEVRVRHYLLNMRSRQDEKWRSARARGELQRRSIVDQCTP
jgi:Ca2+-binding EF-hand superfamily protein